VWPHTDLGLRRWSRRGARVVHESGSVEVWKSGGVVVWECGSVEVTSHLGLRRCGRRARVVHESFPAADVQEELPVSLGHAASGAGLRGGGSF
jgi:hypothetical protein